MICSLLVTVTSRLFKHHKEDEEHPAAIPPDRNSALLPPAVAARSHPPDFTPQLRQNSQLSFSELHHLEKMSLLIPGMACARLAQSWQSPHTAFSWDQTSQELTLDQQKQPESVAPALTVVMHWKRLPKKVVKSWRCSRIMKNHKKNMVRGHGRDQFSWRSFEPLFYYDCCTRGPGAIF